MEEIWNYTFFNTLSVPPESVPVLLSEAPLTPKINRDKTAEIMFESFNIDQLCIVNSSVLSLYAYGRTTGLVIDSGYASTTVVPVYEGYSIGWANGYLDIAGHEITNYLCKLSNSADYQLYNKVKQQFAFVALDTSQPFSASYELPDGQLLTIGDEVYKCAEILFDPKKMGMEMPGISSLVQETIVKCDEEIKNTLYNNIVVCGGTSMLKGFEQRLQKELPMARVSTFVERKYAAWLGGSILGSINHCFSRLYITKEEWQENPAIVHRFYW